MLGCSTCLAFAAGNVNIYDVRRRGEDRATTSSRGPEDLLPLRLILITG